MYSKFNMHTYHQPLLFRGSTTLKQTHYSSSWTNVYINRFLFFYKNPSTIFSLKILYITIISILDLSFPIIEAITPLTFTSIEPSNTFTVIFKQFYEHITNSQQFFQASEKTIDVSNFKNLIIDFKTNISIQTKLDLQIQTESLLENIPEKISTHLIDKLKQIKENDPQLFSNLFRTINRSNPRLLLSWDIITPDIKTRLSRIIAPKQDDFEAINEPQPNVYKTVFVSDSSTTNNSSTTNFSDTEYATSTPSQPISSCFKPSHTITDSTKSLSFDTAKPRKQVRFTLRNETFTKHEISSSLSRTDISATAFLCSLEKGREIKRSLRESDLIPCFKNISNTTSIKTMIKSINKIKIS